MYENNSILSRSLGATGAVSLSLNDSWSGRSLIETLGKFSSMRLASLDGGDMKFQQKQQQEREKKMEQIKLPLASLEAVDGSKLGATFGPGKVRQMFDERRQRGTGIDKSYPLQPISQKTSPTNAKSTTSVSRTSVTTVRRAMGVKQTNGITAKTSQTDMTTTTRINGNVGLLNKLNGNYGSADDRSSLSESLDDEQFPDTPLSFDDELLNNTISTKLPNVGRLNLNNNLETSAPMVNNNNNNNNGGGVKLKPVILKKSSSGEPPRQTATLNGMRKVPLNKTAPSSATASAAVSPTSPSKKSPSASAKSSSATKKSTVKMISLGIPKNPAVNATPPPGTAACRTCGRFFNEDRLEKHEVICLKAANKKRKVFDVTKHRVQGTDAEVYVKKAQKASSKKAAAPLTSGPKNDWRRKHEEFIKAIRAAKEVQQHLAKGGKLSDLPPPPPSENPDYVQCPHCNRKFNETAASRHIPKCANMQHNKPKPPPSKKRF